MKLDSILQARHSHSKDKNGLTATTTRTVASNRPSASLTENAGTYHVDVWQERDNLQITLYDSEDNEIRSWSDDYAREMFEDGFFDRRDLQNSVIEYAKSVGLI